MKKILLILLVLLFSFNTVSASSLNHLELIDALYERDIQVYRMSDELHIHNHGGDVAYLEIDARFVNYISLERDKDKFILQPGSTVIFEWKYKYHIQYYRQKFDYVTDYWTFKGYLYFKKL